MRDRHNAALEIQQQLLKPLDAVQIQMVGRFIQQQNIRLRDQSLRQSHALGRAARQRRNARLRIKMQAMQGFSNALLPIPAVKDFNLVLQRIQITFARAVAFNQIAHPSQTRADRLKNCGAPI